MKKETEIKYPSAANLFQFCRRVLDHKVGTIRVIDQDVGQILDFDPADCSHWKKGKKNIRSIHAMKAIADHLGVDERLVVDVASGEIDDTEGFFEYSGYGLFEINDQIIEKAKKEFYKRNVNTWTRDREAEFKRFFEIDEQGIDLIVEKIHERIGFEESPLYLPEIAATYSDIALLAKNDEVQVKKPVEFSMASDHKITISFQSAGKMRPYIRHHIAKAMSRYFFAIHGVSVPTELGEFGESVADVKANIFASKLLTPAHLVRKELKNLNLSKDIIAQLADSFWVSKTFMNRRLKEIIECNSRF